MLKVIVIISLFCSLAIYAQDSIQGVDIDSTMIDFADLQGADSIYNLRKINYDTRQLVVPKSKADVPMFNFEWMQQLKNETFDFQYIDRKSYQYYLESDWDRLTKLGNNALSIGIDYKNLRKRMGYAYFMQQKYYAAQMHYERALAFDHTDTDVQLYLYYCSKDLGNDKSAGYYVSLMPTDKQTSINIKPFKIIDAVDFEYNYKSNDEPTNMRSEATFYRMGIGTKINNRLNVYLTASQYNQTVNITTPTLQTEFYGAMSWAASAHLNFDAAYHGVNTLVGTEAFLGNLYFGKISGTSSIFHYALSASTLSNKMGTFNQVSLNGGFTIPGKAGCRLSSTMNLLADSTSSRMVFSQSIGAQILKPLWMEGTVTLGNLKNYNDNNAMYLYNTLDATTFRAGVTAFLNVSKNFILVGNYTYDIKEMKDIITNNISNYNQHSISGGIIWKL